MSSNDKNCNLSCAVPNSMQYTSQTQPQIMQPIQMYYPNMNSSGHQLYFRPLALYDTSTMILKPISAQPTVYLPSFQQYIIMPSVFTTILYPTINNNNNNFQTPTNNTACIENSSVGHPSGQVSVPPVPAETCITQTCMQAPAPELPTTSMLMDCKPLPKTDKTRNRKNVRCRCPNCKADSAQQHSYPSGSLKHLCHVAGCRRVFNRPSLLKNHLRCHGGKKTVFCANCDKGYTRKSQLRVHVKSHDNPEPEDESKNGNKIQLQYHKIQLQYLCRFDNCGRTFGDAATLKKHDDWHSANKNMFAKEYSQTNELGIREKTVHTNVEQRKSKGKRSVCNAKRQT